jgi:hypothetical protein
MNRKPLLFAVACSTLVLLSLAALSHAADEKLPAGAVRIVERGKIPAIVKPELVAADRGDLPADAWVLGVALNGEAHAYDLNLLNRHEVVNDRIGDVPFAAVWCPLANTGIAYDRRGPQGELTFEASGCLHGAAIVMQDRETNSWWSMVEGKSTLGKLAETPLVVLPIAEKTTWENWKNLHPNTLVLSVKGVTHVAENSYAEYVASAETYQGMAPRDDRLAPKTPVFVLWDKNGEPIVVPHENIAGGRTFAPDNGVDIHTPNVFLFRKRGAPVTESTIAYWFPQEFKMEPTTNPKKLRQKIESLMEDPISAKAIGVERVVGYDTYWYNWASVHEGTRLE